ncbi:MAG TPA: thiol-disulfide isomerase [Terriglobales bacterium]|nr:thiol-disulfide isomerase [Terriglobales bacterium]
MGVRFGQTAALILAGVFLVPFLGRNRANQNRPPTPTFYRDVIPILEKHCQSCHRPGEIARLSFVSYQETQRWAARIRDVVGTKAMPPWFADPCCGHFSDDPSLTAEEVSTLSAWADTGAPEGDPRNAPPPPHWTEGWNIPQPDAVVKMQQTVAIPAAGDLEYTYEIVPTNFAEDKWVQMSEVRPSSREHVHHAVVYVRPPESDWLRGAPIGVAFTASSLGNEHLRHAAHETKSDMLLVYAPGSSPDRWPDGMAKFIPAHSDLILQMHYTTNGHEAQDQTSVGLVFSKHPPSRRVLTLQLANDHDPIPIPPGAENYRVEVQGTLPNDCTLLSFFPHMHLRGKRFEYNLLHADGRVETLLRVNYDFYWQLSYRLAEPRQLKAGTKLQAVGIYDNSPHNRHNPDPDSAVTWGDQTYNEMMVGFFDVAVPAEMNKFQFFVRHPK